MKAIRVHSYGQPPRLDDVPEPQPTGPEDVIVRIGGAGLCGAEPAQVAALADAGLTAYHAVKKAVPALGPGSSAVAVGAGGLGHIGIQCLKAMTPALVIAVDTSEDALKLALHCGADHAVTAD